MNNVVIKIVTVACFAVLCLELLSGVVKTLLMGRYKRITFLRSFKKGRFAVIYLTAIPLCMTGHLYAGQGYLKAAFTTISKILEIVVLKYDFESIKLLMEADSFYASTVYFCSVMAGLNVVLFTVALANQRIWEFFRKTKMKYCPKDRLFIFGSNPQNRLLYESDKDRCKIIIDKISEDDRVDYYLNEISYLDDMSDRETVEEIFKRRKIVGVFRKLYAIFGKKHKDAENIVVINTGSDERNMLLCRSMTDMISKQTDEEKERLFKTLKIFVFGDMKYEAIYEDIEADGYGCVTYVNKYKKIGMDFIERYPFSMFMNENQVDYKTSLVRKNVNINFFMICFGKVGRQIFLTSVANNQFIAEGENGPEFKKVNYHIFDRNIAQNNKNLNHNYYRFRNEFDGCEAEDYLPLPPLPADEKYYHLDINDGRLYSILKECVCRNKNDINFVLVSFGDDLENIDMAQKLVAKRREWCIENLVIFVRTRAKTMEQTALEEEGCLFIGNESEIVYNIDRLISDKIPKIALMRNEDYDLEYATKGKKPEDITDSFIENEKYASFRRWHKEMHRLRRNSNIYAALSIRAKLNLMGLDYCEVSANDEPALTEEQYLAIYAKDDMPVYSGKTTTGGRKIIEYDIDFLKSRRWNMAVLEHYRWNSYLISKGFVPASIKKIKEETVEKDGKPVYTDGRSYVMRRHGNLTTFEGLEMFRKMVAERDGVSEKDKDVIKYDYQILDDIYYFLTESGYKIIKKK